MNWNWRLPVAQIAFIGLLAAGINGLAWGASQRPWMAQPDGQSEALVDVLDRVNEADRLNPPFPATETVDPLYVPDNRVSREFQQYLTKVAPLYDQLGRLFTHLESNASKPISLQYLSANTHHTVLLYNRIWPTLTATEKQFSSAQLMQRAVTNLHEAVQYWRQRDLSQRPYRTSVVNAEEDAYVLKVKLLAAREAMAELQQLQQSVQLLQTGFAPQDAGR